MKILISEDDSVSRLLLSATLKKLGHDVVETKDGKEAWEIFQKEYFPVLISDWIMPEMDGLELLQMIRAEKREKYTYILLLTVREGKESYLEGSSPPWQTRLSASSRTFYSGIFKSRKKSSFQHPNFRLTESFQ